MSLDVEGFLYNYFERVTPVPTKVGEFRLSPCPNCGNKKRKLYVNTEQQVFHCKVCDYGRNTRITTLMTDMGAVVGDYIIDDGLDSPVSYAKPKEEIALPTKQLPAEYKPIIGSNSIQAVMALNYLRQRGISDSLIADYKIGYCFEGEYKNRVILPYYENGELVYFTGRDFTNSSSQKYLNPHWERTHFLFNYDRVVKGSLDFIVMVEGPFDILSLPDHAVCLLGKTKELSEEQEKLLGRFQRIYVAMDNDATDYSYALCQNLSKRFSNVHTVLLPEGEDPGTLKNKMFDLIKQAKPYVGNVVNPVGYINTDHFMLELLKLRGRR